MTDSLSTTVLRAAKAGKQALIDLVLPPVCGLCGAPVAGQDDFCQTCGRALTISRSWMRHACNRCGMPPPSINRSAAPIHRTPQLGDDEAAESVEPPATLAPTRRDDCSHCRDLEFQFDQVTAMWAYQGRVCDAVVAAKYPRHAALGDALGRRLAEVILEQQAIREYRPLPEPGPIPETVEPATDQLPDVVTYVPSYLTRALARGGTGTAVIAAAVARRLGRPCHPLLRAIRPIAKQAWLDDAAREKNVHDVFSAKRSYAFARSPQPPNRHILIVDDVLTTGATANEVARVLRGAGEKRVSLAVVARAIRSR